MAYTLDILMAYQNEMDWDDNTLVALLADFVDHEMLAEKLGARPADIAKEEKDNSEPSDPPGFEGGFADNH